MKINAVKETKSHGNSYFPFNVYINNMNFIGASLFCHWHEDIEFIYVTEGSALFQINANFIEAQAGQVLLINSNTIHSAKTINNQPCVFKAIVFSPEFVKSSSHDVCNQKYIMPLLQNHFKLPEIISGLNNWEMQIVDHIICILNSFDEKFFGYELLLKSSILKIISILITEEKLAITEYDENSNNQYYINQFKKVFNYIDINYKNKLYVEDLANQINVSPYYFIRLFKEFTGITPIDYITQYRLDKAAYLLLNSNANIMDIALDIGYKNISYFVKKFKEYYHYTPSDYKKFYIDCDPV